MAMHQGFGVVFRSAGQTDPKSYRQPKTGRLCKISRLRVERRLSAVKYNFVLPRGIDETQGNVGTEESGSAWIAKL